MIQDSYRELFFSESQEYLNSINKCLLRIETNPGDFEAINEIFRCMHTLKGMSATMGYDKLTQLSHHTEDLLDELRSKKKQVSAEIIDVLFSCVDILEKLIDSAKAKKEPGVDIYGYIDKIKKIIVKEGQSLAPEPRTQGLEFSPEENSRLRELKASGLNILKIKITLIKDCTMKEARAFLLLTSLKKMGEFIKSIPSVEAIKEGDFDLSFTFILAVQKDDKAIHQKLLGVAEVDEVSIEPVVIEDNASGDIQPQAATTYTKKIQSMRISVDRLDKIMNLMGELAIAKIQLIQIVQSFKIKELEEVSFTLEHLTSTLQDEIIQTRLLPLAYILDTFPRLARDLAKKQGKNIDLEIIGSEIELDRVVLDEIGDPLVHLIRNAIDHGIEDPEERKKTGKTDQGKILIKVSRQKGQIYIEVIDDGRGVNFNEVKRLAIKKGIITEKEAGDLDEKKILDLIALPGFSTAGKITDISGRGVGLDVVKAKMEILGGRVDFETKQGQGSRFILIIPLTLAIIKAMLVRVRNEIFAVPLMSIRETIKIEEKEIKVLQSFEVTRVRDEIIPIIRLEKSMGLEGLMADKKEIEQRKSVVIIEHGKKVLGLVVSQVIGEQDIVVKPLGSIIKKTKGIAGATVLGDGRVALILDTMSLV